MSCCWGMGTAVLLRTLWWSRPFSYFLPLFYHLAILAPPASVSSVLIASSLKGAELLIRNLFYWAVSAWAALICRAIYFLKAVPRHIRYLTQVIINLLPQARWLLVFDWFLFAILAHWSKIIVVETTNCHWQYYSIDRSKSIYNQLRHIFQRVQ